MEAAPFFFTLHGWTRSIYLIHFRSTSQAPRSALQKGKSGLRIWANYQDLWNQLCVYCFSLIYNPSIMLQEELPLRSLR